MSPHRVVTITLLWLSVGVPTAAAFCGAYVGGAATNASSVVVVVREGQRTTLTLVNDYGDATGSFGYVMPVPAGFGPEDIALVDPAVIERLDTYSAPRVVQYSCDDVYWVWEVDEDGNGSWDGYGPGSSPSGCSGSGSSSPGFTQDTDGDSLDGPATYSSGAIGLEGEPALEAVVTAERSTLGSYALSVVHASGADSLTAWLSEEGFSVSEETGAALQGYIEQGSDFLVARVDLDALPEGRSWLEPLRIAYDSELVSLPLRLGATSSAGEQDLLIFGVTTATDGALAISNYPDVLLEHECMTDDADATLGMAWERALETWDEAVWVSEFGWLAGKCDPCANDLSLSTADLAAVGFTQDATDSFFTRMHLRYRPDQLNEDPVLYPSGLSQSWQLRYFVHSAEMEDFLTLCSDTEAWGGAVCEPPEPPVDTGWYADEEEEEEEADSGGLLCGGGALGFLSMGLGSLLRRRR